MRLVFFSSQPFFYRSTSCSSCCWIYSPELDSRCKLKAIFLGRHDWVPLGDGLDVVDGGVGGGQQGGFSRDHEHADNIYLFPTFLAWWTESETIPLQIYENVAPMLLIIEICRRNFGISGNPIHFEFVITSEYSNGVKTHFVSTSVLSVYLHKILRIYLNLFSVENRLYPT